MTKCYCFSEKEFENCCEPILKDFSLAQSPEQLMRARYSAFVLHNIDYILETHHPDTREHLDRESVEIWSKESKWLGLKVLPRSENDLVEFRAHFSMDDVEEVHHELSTFKKHDGKWFFYDGKIVGEPIMRKAPKVGRNDPCHCGSGKKYKKCCA
jgi:SEC-C motif domain protein